MKYLYFKRLSNYFLISTILTLLFVQSVSSSVQSEFSQYFSRLSESFKRIAASSSLKDRDLKKTERLFLGELRNDLAYNTFVRTNSKGQIISEAIRGKKIECPMTDVSKQAWFKSVNEKREFYSLLENDEEKGRYYVIWAKPIENSKGAFLGAVMTKVDLWDCFHDFSKNVYYPFRVKLNGMSFFDHKWKKELIGTEDTILVPGVKKVSIVFIPEQIQPVIDSGAFQKQVATVDTPVQKNDLIPEKKENKKLLLYAIPLLFGVIIIGGWALGALRRRSIQRKIDNDEF